jgi:DNA-binding transcriptional LysR family regulator
VGAPYGEINARLRQLQAFEAVATDLHFGRAARRLFTSQPAVSELIRRLERELGVSLFFRTSRRVELTPAGTELLARTRVILAEVRDAAVAVRRLREGTEEVFTIGITPPAAPVLAPHLAAACTEELPGVAVDLHQMWLPDLLAAVAEAKIDAAITPGVTDPPDGTQMEVIASEPLLAGLRPTHRFAGRSRIAVEDLAGDSLGLLSSRRGSSRSALS